MLEGLTLNLLVHMTISIITDELVQLMNCQSADWLGVECKWDENKKEKNVKEYNCIEEVKAKIIKNKKNMLLLPLKRLCRSSMSPGNVIRYPQRQQMWILLTYFDFSKQVLQKQGLMGEEISIRIIYHCKKSPLYNYEENTKEASSTSPSYCGEIDCSTSVMFRLDLELMLLLL